MSRPETVAIADIMWCSINGRQIVMAIGKARPSLSSSVIVVRVMLSFLSPQFGIFDAAASNFATATESSGLPKRHAAIEAGSLMLGPQYLSAFKKEMWRSWSDSSS